MDETHSDAAVLDIAATVSEDAGDEDDDEADEAPPTNSNLTDTGWAASRVSRRERDDMGRPLRLWPPRPVVANARIDDERGSFDCLADARVV